MCLSRNESATTRPSNILMMSRLRNAYFLPPLPGWALCRSEFGATISYLVKGARSTEEEVQKNPITAPPGRSIRTICLARDWAAGLDRKSKKSQHSTPSTLPSAWRKRESIVAGRASSVPARACRSKSANRSREQLAPELFDEDAKVGRQDEINQAAVRVDGNRGENFGTAWRVRAVPRHARRTCRAFVG